jgi:hypothetical protein
MTEETYLGDGLYASFDGYQIWLRAPREEGGHRVAMETSVFSNFISFADRCWPRLLQDFLQRAKSDQGMSE